MFPRPGLFGHGPGFHFQHPAFFTGVRLHQHNMLAGNYPMRPRHQGNMFHQMGPRLFPAQPQRQMMMHSPLNVPNRGKKRQAQRMKGQEKRRRMNESQQNGDSPSNSYCEVSPHLSSQQINDDKFIVPVSKGTERITVGIWNYFLTNQMSDEDLKKKLLLRKSLHSVTEAAFPNCRLFIVGSSMTGFATKTSDVDMCLMLSEKELDQKSHATTVLNCLLRALTNCSFMQSSQVIRAKVPILKFFDRISGVECDLNVNNTIGVRNTHLLRYYANMDWRVRPLMLFLKRWARFHDINDASKMTISSYSLSLMLIHYLQAGVTPPVLPCLQKMRPDLFNNRSDVRKLSLKLEDGVTFVSENGATLGELFLGFLNYYTNIFNYGREVVSVRLGKRLTKQEAMAYDSSGHWKFLCIEEPFERSNTARSVYNEFVFWRIMRVFDRSFKTLEKTRMLESILSRPF